MEDRHAGALIFPQWFCKLSKQAEEVVMSKLKVANSILVTRSKLQPYAVRTKPDNSGTVDRT